MIQKPEDIQGLHFNPQRRGNSLIRTRWSLAPAPDFSVGAFQIEAQEAEHGRESYLSSQAPRGQGMRLKSPTRLISWLIPLATSPILKCFPKVALLT